MPTPKQLAANRANALHSTGPKTDAGKATASRNSLTHGLLARDLLVHTGGGHEDAGEFRSLLDDLREALAPQGMLERILVEKIAVAYWRLRRAARAEAGAIHSALDDLASRMHADDEDRVIEDMLVLTRGFGYHIVIGDPTNRSPDQAQAVARRRLRSHPLGLRRLIEELDAAIADLQASRPLSGKTRALLYRGFISEDGPLLDAIRPFMFEEGAPKDDAGKDSMLALLQHERTTLAALQLDADRRSALALEAAALQGAVPHDDQLGRIQRYETMHERQLHAAINQLERLQRRRTGEPSIPPIALTLTHDS